MKKAASSMGRKLGRLRRRHAVPGPSSAGTLPVDAALRLGLSTRSSHPSTHSVDAGELEAGLSELAGGSVRHVDDEAPCIPPRITGIVGRPLTMHLYVSRGMTHDKAGTIPGELRLLKPRGPAVTAPLGCAARPMNWISIGGRAQSGR
jgi:hypothetical protein